MPKATHDDTVLVVEDDDEARANLIQLLQFEGFVAKGFENGAAALDYMKKSKEPCLVVLDMRMPVMDGAELRAALLRDPRLAAIPVVVVTAYDPSAAAGLGAVRVFRKPLDFDALMNVVREHC
jgi:CheY-like chemotaxis protein